jgi:hypothetical protein
VKYLLILLEIFIRGESELSNRVVREEVSKRLVVVVNVPIIGLSSFKAFMKVEVIRARILKVLLTIKNFDFFGVKVAGRGERFNHALVSYNNFTKSFNIDLFL